MKIKRKTKNMVIGIVVVSLLATVTIIALSSYAKAMMGKIPALSFDEALGYTLEDNRDALITIGILQDGKSSYAVYGNNAEILFPGLHTYEIGSITKIFTAELITKAVRDGRITLDDTIDCYLTLPDGNNYPTVADLVTHTSGYKPYYFERLMVSNFFTGRNDFFGITKEMVAKKLASLRNLGGVHQFAYSNFGYATLGLILEEVYDQEYTELMNGYLQDELHMKNTRISDGDGDLSKYWDWKKTDAYLPAGGMVSDIEDMLAFAQLQLDEELYSVSGHDALRIIGATTDAYAMLDIRMDSVGMGWILDEENNIVWHNGGTDDYNSYLGFDPQSDTAVVILSNLPPDYRIPSTVLGVKRLQELRGE